MIGKEGKGPCCFWLQLWRAGSGNKDEGREPRIYNGAGGERGGRGEGSGTNKERRRIVGESGLHCFIGGTPGISHSP